MLVYDMKKKTVQVLLSTYNGEKYIKEQLNSLFNQEGVIVKVLLRDDGSKDNTLKIVQEYKKLFPIKILIGNNLGFAKSFWSLVKSSGGADYYAFCDQDDIWEKDKLKCALNQIDKYSSKKNIPVLYTSNAIAVDNNMQILSTSAFDFHGVLTLADSLQRSVLPGCTFVFNKRLQEYAKKYNGEIIAHDWLMYQLAEIFGVVTYDDKSHIKYRIHENNTIGINSKFQILMNKIKRQFKPLDVPRRSKIVEDILVTYGNEIPKNKRNLLLLFSNANNWKNWKKVLSIKEYRNIDFILMMFLGRI